MDELSNLIQLQIIQANSNNSQFFRENEMIYCVPFIIFYKKQELSEDDLGDKPPLRLQDYISQQLKIPHQSERVQFYEDFLQAKYSSKDMPPKPIHMVKHKLFVVQYQEEFLNAIDGLNTEESVNLLALPILRMYGSTQFIIKLYNQKQESYGQILSALLEL